MAERLFHHRGQLNRLVQISRLAASHYRTIETDSLRISRAAGEEPKAWGYWNSTWKQEEQNFAFVLPQGFAPLISRTRDLHTKHGGQIVALTFGSNNSAVEGLLSEHDVQIAVALQDVRSPEEQAHDTMRGFYLIPGTIGDPALWRKLRSLFASLFLAGKIHEQAANIVIGGMKAGWGTLPLDAESVFSLEEDMGIDHQPMSEEALSFYREWIEANIWRITSPRGTIVSDAPATLHEEIAALPTRLPSRRHTCVYHGDASMRSRVRIDRRDDETAA